MGNGTIEILAIAVKKGEFLFLIKDKAESIQQCS
jgi:hypothetical protein